MILISHRGNINGRFESYENEPNYIDNAIVEGYDVEIDVWYVNGRLLLGHDKPQYGINLRWITDRISKLWVHCKDIESLVFFKNNEYNINYFWHENDKVTITSHKHIWSYPTEKFEPKTIAVLPELYNSTVEGCYGVCSDYIINYK